MDQESDPQLTILASGVVLVLFGMACVLAYSILLNRHQRTILIGRVRAAHGAEIVLAGIGVLLTALGAAVFAYGTVWY